LFERALLLPGLELLSDQVRQRRESTDSGAGVSTGVRLDRDTNGLIAGLIPRRELVESACRGRGLIAVAGHRQKVLCNEIRFSVS
jgi:hypothetical protein